MSSSLLLLLLLLLAAPAFLTPPPSTELEVRGQRSSWDAKEDSMKVMISGGCITQGDSSDAAQGGKEIDLTAGAPLVLTHKIKLVPSGSGSGSGSCDCEVDLAALRERLERLEREVSNLREKCEGGCCSSKESKGPGCSIKPGAGECPNECSDQGRCVDGKCVCFSGFSGPDCSESDCPGNCNSRGRCVNGQCVCDAGFSGKDCSAEATCPGNCNRRGRCVNGKCVCNPGFTGPDCSKRGCPGNCNNNGRCVNGRCVCDSGFSGADCSENGCPGNCNNRGRCVDGECVCNEGFGGPDCSEIVCPNDCYDRGRCVNGVCQCDVGFTGEDCSETACPGNCNNRGRCVNGRCICDDGFTGEDCSDRGCPGNCNNRGRCVNGRCICDSGSTGDDCSEDACPGNCNNRGRCVNGQCICDEGFAGEDCSEKACPGNCNNRGRCVNGRCVCDSGSTGEDCSEDACPDNCNNRGRCVNGQCVCDDGFTGEDCSEKACPNNCSNRGRCVNGKCVCEVGFAGPDCAAKSCPNNCSNKGRCVKGRCVCRRGFTGPDCSQCEEGMTGANCDTAMSGVSQLRTRDVTETSVVLVWDPPPVRYETYTITFTSQKEIDQKISEQVDGALTTFTQTGLAAGQEYTVSVIGETDGRKGAESTAEFKTLISGPSNLKVVKTTTTSAVVQWEESQGEIDRYRLIVTPSDGSGTGKDMTIPAGQDSAHITELEAGRLYDIILMAEKGRTQSGPATTQVTPGQTSPRGSTAALTLQVPTGTRQDSEDPRIQPSAERLDKDPKASGIAKTKLPLKKKVGTGGARPALPKKPNVPGPNRSNTTRAVPGGKKVGQGPPRKIPVGEKRKVPVFAPKRQPGVTTTGDRAPSTDGTDGTEAKEPAMISGADPETRKESSSEGPALTVGSKEQTDVGRESRGNDTTPVSSEPRGTIQSQEKKCFNKVKVTHLRLPIRDRGSGCRAGGEGLAGKTPDDAPDVDYSSDPLYKLLTETYQNLNNTNFSVHLSKASDLVYDPESVREQILDGLQPLSSFRSSSSPEETPQQPSQSLPPSSSSHSSPSEASSLSISEASSSPSSLPAPSPSSPSSSSSPPSSDSSESDEAGSENSRKTVSPTSPDHQSPPTSGKRTSAFFRRTSTKPGYGRRPNNGPFQNRTNPNLRFPQRPPARLHPDTRREITQTSTGEIRPTVFPSAGDVNPPVGPSSGDKDVAPASSEDEDKKTPTGRGTGPYFPFHRNPPKPGYPRQRFANFGSLQNQTRPNRRPLPAPSRPVSPVSESSEEPPAPSSPPDPKEPHPAGAPVPEQEETPGRAGLTNKSGGVGPGKTGPYRRPMFGGRFQNGTNPNQRVFRVPVRRPLPNRNGGGRIPPGSPTNQLETQGTDEIQGRQDAPRSPKEVQEQDPAEGVPGAMARHDPLEPETNVLHERGNVPIKITNQGAKETSIQDPDPDRDQENLSRGQDPRATSPGRPTSIQDSDPDRDQENLNRGQDPRATSPGRPTGIQDSDPDQDKEKLHGGQDPRGSSSGRPTSTQDSDLDKDQENLNRGHNPRVASPGRPTSIQDSDPDRDQENLNRGQDPRATSPGRPTGIQDSDPDQDKEKLHGGQDPRGSSSGRPTSTQDSDLDKDQENLNRGHNPRVASPGRPTSIQDSDPDRDQENLHGGQDPRGTSPGRQTTIKDSDPNQDQGNLIAGQDPRATSPGRETSIRDFDPDQDQENLNRGQDPRVASPGRPTSIQDFDLDQDQENLNGGQDPRGTSRGRPTAKDSDPSIPRRRPPPARGGPTRQHPSRVGHHFSEGQRTENKPSTGSKVPPTGVTRQPLDHVGVTNRTAKGFALVWDSPEGKYKNFVVTRSKVEKDKIQEDPEREDVTGRPTKGDENRVPETVSESSTTESNQTFKKLLPASARSFQFDNLPPQTEYTVTLLGKGPGILSRMHKLVISTGPEPPTDIVFSELTDKSLTVSWTKPKSAVSGFKVTYTHKEEGEPVSVSVDSGDSSLGLSKLSPGSTYEVSIISVLGLDESDPLKDFVTTLPDPPTDLRAVNVTDTTALLLWRPALAAVDNYAIVYGSGTDSEVRVSVSGNAAEHPLSGLQGSTTYTVTITSQLGGQESAAETTSFTTTGGSGGSGEGPRDLQATNVTPRTALISWKAPPYPVGSYRLTYQNEDQQMKEVIVDASVTQLNLTRLHPGSTYTVQLQAEEGGRFSNAVSTEFTTGTLRFPFPTDCTQELQNGIRTSGEVEIFPWGKQGTPIMVYCDMETDGGGWMVFQRRKDGSVDFFRGWKDYTQGFGDVSGEFWLGLDNLHNLTTKTKMILRVDLRDGDEAVFAKYSTFEVARRNYKLSVGGYSGTAGDSLTYHNNRLFSTKDRDPMPFITRCAMSYRGGWWYKNCHEANLNGLYGIDVKHQGIIWTGWKGKEHSIPFTEMKMRPASFRG